MQTTHRDTQIQTQPDTLQALLAELEHYRRLMAALHTVWPELARALERTREDEHAE